MACPNCGDINVTAVDVLVSYCLEAMTNSYQFCCPRCTFWVARKAGPGEALKLVRAGARARHTYHPAHDQIASKTFEDQELVEFLLALEDRPTAT